MLVYRIYPHLPGAPPDAAGHPMYVSTQGAGRLDNPGHYRIWYLALEPAGAVAEAFGDLNEWNTEMFAFPSLPESRLTLATYHLQDDIPLLDLDDARNLYVRGLRPTQIIERNRTATQAWALGIYSERNDRGARIWHGVRWWSYHRPQWRIVGYWGDDSPRVLQIEELTVATPAVTDAATSLKRRVRLPTAPPSQVREAAAFREEVFKKATTDDPAEAELPDSCPNPATPARRRARPLDLSRL